MQTPLLCDAGRQSLSYSAVVTLSNEGRYTFYKFIYRGWAVAREVRSCENTSAKYGTFKLCKKSKNGLRHHLKDCHANKRSGNFTFKIYVDYSCLPLTDQYLCDASNYATSTSSYKVTSVAPLNASTDGYTHCITLTANDSKHLCASSCDILLKKLFPAWIEQCNDAEGTAPLPGKRSDCCH